MLDVTDFVRDPPDSAVAFTNARKVRFKGEDVDDALMSLELASKERGSDLGPQLLLSLNDLAFPSDFNSDGAVTDDLLNWQSGYGISTGATRGDASAAGDGNVEGSDFLSWQRSLAMSIVQPLLASAVPEPSSLLLALTFPFASRVRY